MSFDEIVSRVTKRLNQTSSAATTRVGETVNDVYKAVTSSIGLNVTRRTQVQANTTQGVQTLTFTGIEKVISVIDKSGGSDRFLDEVLIDELKRGPIADSDSPTKYAIYRSNAGSVQIYLNVNPQTAFTLYADGYVQADTLSGSQEPAFPESFHDILVSGTLAEEYMKLEKPSLAKREEDKYNDRLGDLRIFIAKSPQQDIYQGKLSGQAAYGAVAGGASGGASTGATSYTQTGLITFDRTGAASTAPFAVATGSAYVANLDADMLDGQHGSYYTNASNLASGTVPLARISGLTNTQIDAAAAIAWSKLNKTGSSLADLTTRSASDLSSGTLPDGRFPATLPAASGANLTALSASALASGLVPDARIPGLTTDGASKIRALAFPATQVASSDANTLDDYEEGTWTPVIGGSGGTSGQTYAANGQVGHYVKVGRLIICTFRAELSNKGTITGNVQIQGLPFAALTATNHFAPVALVYVGLATTWVNVTGRVQSGSSVADVAGATAAATTNVTALTTADIANTTVLGGTFMYITAS